jgi:hypothetical protein
MLKPLLELFSASFEEGIFQSMSKNSVMKPIYKKGTKEDVIPALSKILEK